MSTIAIVGGGLSGLVLARILQNHGIPATVYERDATAAARGQGGSLDMHEESGQRALREAGLYDEFRRHTHPQGEHLRILDKTGKVHIDTEPDGGEGGRPEIDRSVLRDLLVASLEPGRIVWDRRVPTTALGDGRHELAFDDDDGGVIADLLVGADGTWSRVRPLLSAATPRYCGISHVELRISNAVERYPDSAALVGPGMFFALSDNKGILGHGGEHLHLAVSLRAPRDWTTARGVDWTDADAARDGLLAELADWDSSLTDLIRRADGPVVPRQIHALPTGHSWARVPGVTLVGDAAHVMSPYAGEGANLAMLDATELASAIIEHPGDLETALVQYETAMFRRAAEAAEMSAQGLEMCFSGESPRELVGFFTGMDRPATTTQGVSV